MPGLRTIARRAPTLALAATLLASTLGPTVPAHAADPPDARDPDRRIVIVLKSVYVSDDHDWGTGEMRARLRFLRTNEGCSPGQTDPPSCETRLASDIVDFPANDGDNVTLNRAIPGTGPHADVADSSMIGPEIGIPVWNHRSYRFALLVEEVDRFADQLGTATAVLSASNGWLLGTHTARGMVSDAAGEPGDFSAEYEIRDAPLPDLRPVGLKVLDVPGSGKRNVCVPVQNAGIADVGRYEVAIQVDGVIPPDGRVPAGYLSAGQAAEVCVPMALPATGQLHLRAIVDEPRAITEVSETNNRFDGGYVSPRVGEAQGPLGQPPVGNADPGRTNAAPQATSDAAQADLTVAAINVNGQAPDGKDDCKEGGNDVAVVVKNAGKSDAGSFVVRLAVDGGEALEESVKGLEAGKEREVRFEGLRLKKGEQKLTALVDAKDAGSESNEENNDRVVTARCKDA